jgi:hypothetical protein
VVDVLENQYLITWRDFPEEREWVPKHDVNVPLSAGRTPPPAPPRPESRQGSTVFTPTTPPRSPSLGRGATNSSTSPILVTGDMFGVSKGGESSKATFQMEVVDGPSDSVRYEVIYMINLDREVTWLDLSECRLK